MSRDLLLAVRQTTGNAVTAAPARRARRVRLILSLNATFFPVLKRPPLGRLFICKFFQANSSILQGHPNFFLPGTSCFHPFLPGEFSNPPRTLKFLPSWNLLFSPNSPIHNHTTPFLLCVSYHRYFTTPSVKIAGRLPYINMI